jgi:hypothetical protein
MSIKQEKSDRKKAENYKRRNVHIESATEGDKNES